MFENIKPFSEWGIQIGLKRWEQFQCNNGKPLTEVREHLDRFGKNYFPITVSEHLRLLNEVGFGVVELLWYSYRGSGKKKRRQRAVSPQKPFG